MRRVAVVVGVAAAIATAGAAPASAEGRPPRLERFVARYNPATTTTFYIAVAGDPDGGKLTYRWTLQAECGYLTDPEATGPSQGFQHGPPARRPDGCTNEQDRTATITLRVTDSEGCAIVYTQGARDETEHLAPPVRALPCPPTEEQPEEAPPIAPSGSFPVVPVLLVGAVLLGAFALARYRRRPRPDTRPDTGPDIGPDIGPDSAPWEQGEPVAEPAPASSWPERAAAARTTTPAAPTEPRPAVDDLAELPLAAGVGTEPEEAHPLAGDVLPTIRASERIIDDVPSFMEDELDVEEPPLFAEDEPFSSLGSLAGPKPPAPCADGSVRKLDNDFVAHDTVLAGAVRARTLRGDAVVEIPPDDPAEILRLAAGISDDAPLEVEVEIPLRLVTVVSTRREVCRDGVWVPEIESATHDGPARVERLRAIAGGPDELERFAREILAKRLRTLTAARRRLEGALAAMRDRH